MKRLLTPAFFKFLFGFLAILSVSFMVMSAVGFWNERAAFTVDTAAVPVEATR